MGNDIPEHLLRFRNGLAPTRTTRVTTKTTRPRHLIARSIVARIRRATSSEDYEEKYQATRKKSSK